jgi:hypothetical protein
MICIYHGRKEFKIMKEDVKMTDTLIKLVKEFKNDEFKKECVKLGREKLIATKYITRHPLLVMAASFHNLDVIKFLIEEMGLDLNEQS